MTRPRQRHRLDPLPCSIALALLLTQCQWLLGIETRRVGEVATTMNAGAASGEYAADGGQGGAGNTSGGVAGVALGGDAGVALGGVAGEALGGRAGDAAAGNAAAGDAAAGQPAVLCDVSNKFGKPELVAELSSQFSEWSMRLSGDGLSAYFTSDREGNGTRFLPGYDIFVAERETLEASFGKAVRVSELSMPPPTPDVNASETADGLSIYFDSYRPGRHIWQAHRQKPGASYAQLQEVVLLSSTNEDFEPYVTPDGAALYFTSSRPTAKSQQGFNLFAAHLEAGNVIDFAEVEGLNTDASERFPVISADQLTLFFASNRDGPAELSDIFVATRQQPSGPFESPKPVAELNTLADDFPTYLTSDGCELYFTSSGGGNEDLYRASRRPAHD